MYIATNKLGNFIDVDDANPCEEYRCPFCNSPVIIKNGSVNATHFAHVSGLCTDTWNYDMSEWHRHMQKYFPKEAREVVVTNGNAKHRADILIKKTVIEIQHSPISAEEFAERNTFFRSLGYRIAWIFDVSKQFESKQLYFSSDDNFYLMTWKHPMRILSVGEKPSDDNTNYAIWLYKGSNEEYDIIEKVIWSAENDYGEPSFKQIIVSDFSICLNANFEIDDFFISKTGWVKREIQRLNKKYKYAIKYSGEKGKKRENYICPRTKEFGIHVYGDYGCLYCSYCYMILQKSEEGQNDKFAVYCCYPEQIHKVYTEDPCYESCDVPMHDI
jgi:hypothetical protein